MNWTAEQFSKRFPVGTPVRYFPVRGQADYEDTAIRSDAWELASGHVVVKVKGRPGGVSIEHIRSLGDE